MRLLVEKVAVFLDLLQGELAYESSMGRGLLVGALPCFRVKCAIRTTEIAERSAHRRTNLDERFRYVVVLLDSALFTGVVKVAAGDYVETAAHVEAPVNAKARCIAVLTTAQFYNVRAASL